MNKRNKKKTTGRPGENRKKLKQSNVNQPQIRPPKAKQQAREAKDISSKVVFKNAKLCSQFINDNLDTPLLKNVRPEDIEDVTARYQPYLGVEFEADTVKKVHLHDSDGKETDMPLFVLPLIEHKSAVDYNTPMQLLRYMSCIWYAYGKEMEEKHKGITRTKDFRYPPILPIVYYEGAEAWSAPLNLQGRIHKSEIFGKNMPDFTYEVVRNHDYTIAELLERGDEMSLIMMLTKIQNTEDLAELRKLPSEQIARMDRILENTTEEIRKIMQDVVYALLMKMNVPVEEANEQVKWMGENRMGYFFENFEKVDIQEERRNTAKARAEAEEAKQEAEEAKQKVKEAEYKIFISACKEFEATKGEATKKVIERFHLSSEDAGEKVEQYWE